MTALGAIGTPSRAQTFIAKDPVITGGKSSDRITQLNAYATTGNVLSFVAKTPVIGGGKSSDRVTGLNPHAASGKIYNFEPKAPPAEFTGGGHGHRQNIDEDEELMLFAHAIIDLINKQ